VELILDVPQGYSIERLDKTFHERRGFFCGVEPLDRFLETQASQAQGKDLSTTHVLLDDPARSGSMRPIIGYVTLMPLAIPIADAASAFTKTLKGRHLIQGQLIARMAVDRKYQRRGLGQFLLSYALKCCWEIYQKSAFNVVFIDAKDENLKDFYMRFGGFQELKERSLRLFLPVATIGKLL
jgi:GNAT superfamily N-acetyltransferase